MGTSNWQNIPYGIETIMAIEPLRVLDVGMGYGRWGMLLREFGELWFNRVHRKDWRINIEGVEAFEKNIDEYQSYFYNSIHHGDFSKIYKKISQNWDLVIFGDVLEHFKKDTAIELLQWATTCSGYVMINIPIGSDWPQEDLYENEYERHLSEWEIDDFRKYHLVRFKKFFDFQGRPFATLILSKEDPKSLKKSLFSYDTKRDPLSGVEDDSMIEVPNELQSENNFLRTELKAIQESLSYRAAQKIAHSTIGKYAAKLHKKKT